MQHIRWLILSLCTLALGACATATVVPVGNARAAIDPAQVRFYAQPPAHYEVLGLLSGDAGIEGTGQDAVNHVIEKLKQQAAKLGANGVLVGKNGQRYAGSYGGSSYLGWGMFANSSSASYTKAIEAQAIYVPDGSEAAAPSIATAHAPEQDGQWPLQLPRFDIIGNCQRHSADPEQCVVFEQSAREWLNHHSAPVQIAGACSVAAQQDESYASIKSCVQEREGR